MRNLPEAILLEDIAVYLERSIEEAEDEAQKTDPDKAYPVKAGVLVAACMVASNRIRSVSARLKAPLPPAPDWPYEVGSTDITMILAGDEPLPEGKDLARFLLAVAEYLERNGSARSLAGELRRKVEVMADSAGICARCGGDLQVDTWEEPRPYETAGAMERMTERYCPNCEVPPSEIRRTA